MAPSGEGKGDPDSELTPIFVGGLIDVDDEVNDDVADGGTGRGVVSPLGPLGAARFKLNGMKREEGKRNGRKDNRVK